MSRWLAWRPAQQAAVRPGSPGPWEQWHRMQGLLRLKGAAQEGDNDVQRGSLGVSGWRCPAPPAGKEEAAVLPGSQRPLLGAQVPRERLGLQFPPPVPGKVGSTHFRTWNSGEQSRVMVSNPERSDGRGELPLVRTPRGEDFSSFT